MYGHFSLREDTWLSKLGATHERNIEAGTLGRPIEEVSATLLHEMCHLYRYGNGITDNRLSRNKSDIKNELQYFKDHGIRLKVIDLPTTMMELPEGQAWVFDMVNNILMEVLGAIAEQERVSIRRRQKEGIAAAEAKGKHLWTAGACNT